MDQQIVNQTKRVTSSELETVLYEPFKVLDHGFIRVVDYMGDDSSIVQAARVSYGKGTKKTSQDRALIFYLLRNLHTTPFEMCEIKLHVKLPIFVARQWVRHRTASINECSARYSILNKEFYLPSDDVISTQSLDNKQGRTISSGNNLNNDIDNNIEEDLNNKNNNKNWTSNVLEILKKDAERSYENYEYLLNDPSQKNDEDSYENSYYNNEHNKNTYDKNECSKNVYDEKRPGLARELARMNLTLNFYTQWYWKIDLHNLLNFLRLRADNHAQYEIRVYAEIILNEIVKRWVPIVYDAFCEYKLNSRTFSQSSLSVLKSVIKGQPVSFEKSGMSSREWNELQNFLNE